MGGFDRPGQDNAGTTQVGSNGAGGAGPGKQTLTEQIGPIRVTASALNVRRAPSTENGAVAGVLHGGTEVTPTARRGDWHEIPYASDRGFIYAAYTERIRPGAPPPPKAEKPHDPDPAPVHDPVHEPPKPPPAPSEVQAPPKAPVASVVTTVAWTPPAGSALTDANLLQLGAQVHDPRMQALLVNLGGLEKEAQLAKKMTGAGSEMEYTNAEHREALIRATAVVRGQLEQLDANDAHVAAFKVAAYHEIERLAPYHFQKNIRAIETWDKAKDQGGKRQWSTCNLTSLAMCLEVVGIGASNFPQKYNTLLEQTSKLFENDINAGKDDQGDPYAGAVLTAKGKGTSLDKVMGFRLPDFLELAAIVYATVKGGFAHDDKGITQGAAAASVDKTGIPFLKGLAAFMSAKPTEVTLTFDADPTKNAAIVHELDKFGGKHRGIYTDAVEKMNTERNLMENAAAKEAVATTDKEKKRYETDRTKAEAYYKDLDKANHRWLDDPEIEKKLPIENYKNTVTRELGKRIDQGQGVIVGLSGHYVRLYEVNAEGVSVQDPGQWNRAEMRITWAEARAMGYFWTNLVISS